MGPLQGTRVIEVGSIGPGPFAAMLLADMGADVIRLSRPNQPRLLGGHGVDPLYRGRACAEVDLKTRAGRQLVLRLAEEADALIEGFRPGVMERLGLGPDVLAARNERLVYGRITGLANLVRWRRSPGTTSTTSQWRARWGPSPAQVSGRCFR
jgi:alpha-methylacyl-CoA racemase